MIAKVYPTGLIHIHAIWTVSNSPIPNSGIAWF